jgi:hypothetical protein
VDYVELSRWLAALDDFRNWLIREAAQTVRSQRFVRDWNLPSAGMKKHDSSSRVPFCP